MDEYSYRYVVMQYPLDVDVKEFAGLHTTHEIENVICTAKAIYSMKKNCTPYGDATPVSREDAEKRLKELNPIAEIHNLGGRTYSIHVTFPGIKEISVKNGVIRPVSHFISGTNAFASDVCRMINDGLDFGRISADKLREHGFNVISDRRVTENDEDLFSDEDAPVVFESYAIADCFSAASIDDFIHHIEQFGDGESVGYEDVGYLAQQAFGYATDFGDANRINSREYPNEEIAFKASDKKIKECKVFFTPDSEDIISWISSSASSEVSDLAVEADRFYDFEITMMGVIGLPCLESGIYHISCSSAMAENIGLRMLRCLARHGLLYDNPEFDKFVREQEPTMKWAARRVMIVFPVKDESGRKIANYFKGSNSGEESRFIRPWQEIGYFATRWEAEAYAASIAVLSADDEDRKYLLGLSSTHFVSFVYDVAEWNEESKTFETLNVVAGYDKFKRDLEKRFRTKLW